MKQVIVGNKNEANIVNHAGYSFVIINDMASVSMEKVRENSAVIIEAKTHDFVKLVITEIRKNNNPEIYLKPVFLLEDGAMDFPIFKNLSDGVLNSMSDLDLILPELERITARTRELTFANSISFEAQMITKLLSFLHIKRQKVVDPVPYAFSNLNYYYPFLSVNFSPKEEHVVLTILDIAEREGILRSKYHDRVYVCPSCSGSHLSYREVCPKCSSSDTVPDDIVHHFPCGYVGPMLDFSNEIDDHLDCPKCNKRLRHIGVDYDKPSVIHECRNCNHKFQDYYVNAMCLSCGDDKNVEFLTSREIKSYRLTKKGELAAIKGFVTTTKDIEEIVGTIKYDTFKTMLKYEIERLKQTEGASNLCAINIRNSSEVYSKLGSDLQRSLLKDFVSVIRSNIRSSDVISFESSSTIVLSMNDIPFKIATRILSSMIELLDELLKTSFEGLHVEFVPKVIALDYTKTHEVQLRELIADFT